MVSKAPTYRMWKENFPGQIARSLHFPFSPSPELGWQQLLVKQDHASKCRAKLCTNCIQGCQGHCWRMVLQSRLQYSPSVPDNQMAPESCYCFGMPGQFAINLPPFMILPWMRMSVWHLHNQHLGSSLGNVPTQGSDLV